MTSTSLLGNCITEPDQQPDLSLQMGNLVTGRAKSLLNLKPPWNSQTARLAAQKPRKMTAAAIRQRKLARIAGFMATELSPERLTSLRLKQAILEATDEQESLKIAALEVLAAIGDKPLNRAEDKMLILKMIIDVKKILG